MVPAFFAAVMIGLFAMQYFEPRQRPDHGALTAATMIAVIARLGDQRAREQARCWSRCGPTTLTGLGNQGRTAGRPGGPLRRAPSERAG